VPVQQPIPTTLLSHTSDWVRQSGWLQELSRSDPTPSGPHPQLLLVQLLDLMYHSPPHEIAVAEPVQGAQVVVVEVVVVVVVVVVDVLVLVVPLTQGT
jgi:hypothetical protein